MLFGFLGGSGGFIAIQCIDFFYQIAVMSSQISRNIFRKRSSAIDIALKWLGTMHFQIVTENTIKLTRPIICRPMGYELGYALDIRCRSRSRGEKDAFDVTRDETKFGRCAKLMETNSCDEGGWNQDSTL